MQWWCWSNSLVGVMQCFVSIWNKSMDLSQVKVSLCYMADMMSANTPDMSLFMSGTLLIGCNLVCSYFMVIGSKSTY